jgi:hemerythrin HHE cation binding domain-containing protein
MELIACIKADHDEALAHFEQLAELAHDDRRTCDAMRTAVRLTCGIKIHAHAEEKVIYEAMRERGDRLAAFSREGRYEHQMLEMLLDRLLVQRPGPELSAILKVARDQFVHHARDEEEAVLLPALEQLLEPSEIVQLTEEFRLEQRRIRPMIERAVGPAPRASSDSPGHHGLHISHHRR